MTYMLLPALACGILASPALAETPQLGKTYTDSLRGFSIGPPAGADVRIEPVGSELVTFNLRDSQTKAVRLWMKISQAQERQEDTSQLEPYARKLASQLGRDENFQVDLTKLRIIGAAGKPAIDLQGPIGGTTLVFCRQVWVQTQPGKFLVVSTFAPLDKSAEVMSVSQASLNSLTLFDPKAAMEKREASLKAGQTLLEQILAKPQKLAAAIAPDDYWLAILKGGEMIGFAHYRESLQSQARLEGVQVTCEIVVVTPEEGQNFSRQEMWASLDATQEKWEKHVMIVDPKGAATIADEFGLKQKEVLLVQTQMAGQSMKNHEFHPPLQVYVPQAFTSILPRLIDRSTGACSFAVFNSGTNNVDMRTISYVGPDKVVLGGQTFSATVLTDQMAVDAPVSTVYLSSAGIPLKITTPSGTGLQQTTSAAVLGKYSKEYDRVKQLGKPQ